MRERFDLTEPFASLWRGKDPIREAFALDGEEFRRVKNRRTFRFVLNGESFFCKCHSGVGWLEILKNLIQGKRPVAGADDEYDAIRHLEQIGVHTMTIRAFGSRGDNPAARESFLVTDELKNKESLEDFCGRWIKEPPSSAFRHRMIRALAETAARMHFSGLNHRDCYLCHFLIDLPALQKENRIDLYVLDLHRAQLRKAVPYHYWVKDLAGIFFSSLDLPLSRRDWLRFVAIYSSFGALRPSIWQAVYRAGIRLYRKEHGKSPAVIPPVSSVSD